MQWDSIAKSKGDVWYVYDGECPLCRTAAHALRIRESVGALHLVNAREDIGHPVLEEINKTGLDLDKGTVMKFGGRFYHGADAMTLMALLGSNIGWFNKMNAALFSSPALASIAYPFIRSGRNILLALKNVGQLHNLQSLDPQHPVFQSIFGESWGRLPTVLHKHYANRPYSRDVVTVKGIMKIEMHPIMRPFMPLIRLFKVLVPYSGVNIPVTVHFRSNLTDARYEFDRIFHLPDGDYHFHSRMMPAGGNEVIEWTKAGIGWNARYRYDGKRVRMDHRRFTMRLLGKVVRLPVEWIFGRSTAWEEAIDESRFNMAMEMQHFLFGRLYAYSGEFTVTEVTLDR
jgi:predicted DCC family thiol-disulfide oxidoreductase YuxK